MILSKVKLFINLTNLVSALILVCVLLTDNYRWHNIVYYVFFISYVIEFFLDKKWKKIVINKTFYYFLAILLFFSLALLVYPFEASHQYFRLLLERRYPLLGFSIVGIFGVNRFFKLRYFIASIVGVTVFAILYIIFLKVGLTNFLQNKNLFNFARSQYVNSHMEVNFYFNSAIIGIWYLISTYWNKLKKVYYSGFFMLSLFLILYALSISEGRSGFLFGLGVTVILTFFEFWRKKKKVAILFGICIPWIAVILISSHQRMEAHTIKTEPRLFLWESGLSVIKQSPLLGFGMTTAQVKFDEAREKFQTEEFRLYSADKEHLDCHNQYIQTTMEFGLIGFTLLLVIYFSPYFLVLKRRKKLALVFVLLVAYQSVFDMFTTGFFSSIFCLWLLFLLRTGKEIRKVENQKLLDV